ncbi:MAG: hypothetical protein IJP27_04620 [Clostridia bacterium]|nr:hypothetical protein [Clostridia bacterium]
MEYETVILEMLARIQALEEQVKELKAQQIPLQKKPLPHRSNTKVTEEMLLACYEAGKQAVASEYADAVALAEQVHHRTGMNKNNALMTIFGVVALLNGELYKRALSGKATKKYFDLILADYGKGKLQLAIAAMRKHIDYRRALHHNVDLLEEICDRYQEMI